jgi:acetoin utilization deacetylase AcuC-like enzyme
MPAIDPADGTNPPPAPTGLVTDDRFDRHETGWGHPECPERRKAVLDGISHAGLSHRLVPIRPREATAEDLGLCHTRAYIRLVERETAAGRPSLSTGDTAICRRSYAVARLAAGAGLAAVDAVVAGRVHNAFVVARPPGHHASADRGMGFCLFNNVAIAARYAQKRHRLRHVLIVDWDVHHGNGTQDIFYDDGSVLYFSTHQSPWYPGTGRSDETGSGCGVGTTLNVPLPAGSGRVEMLTAMRDTLLPAAERFRPDIVLISAGFDGATTDPIGHLELADEDFAELTRLAVGIAHKHAGSRLVSVLEGGYDLQGLGSAAAAHVRVLTEA